MTIYLPEDITSFHKAFDASCERIIQSENNAIFYALFVQLITSLQEHSLIKNYILKLEDETVIRKHEFDSVTLEALEETWIRLWKYHRHSFKLCKRLVLIKRIVTDEVSCSPLYLRILFEISEFCTYSPFCKLFFKASRLFLPKLLEVRAIFAFIRSRHLPKKSFFFDRVVLHKKIDEQNIWLLFFDSDAIKHSTPFKNSVERLPTTLISLKIGEIEKKYFIPGQNRLEKCQNMQIMAEISPSFCWEKLLFFKKCYISKVTFSSCKRLKGRWSSIRDAAWASALERCENGILNIARQAFLQKLTQPCSSIDSFLVGEHQIQRKDYEKFLQVLKNHIQSQLLRMQDAQIMQAAETSQQLKQLTEANNGRIERENFVINHAKKYRAEFPLETHNNMFNAYRKECPRHLVYGLTKWKKIINDNHLDPRTPEEKKKTLGRPPKKHVQKIRSEK